MTRFGVTILAFAAAASINAQSFQFLGAGAAHGQAHIQLSGVPGSPVDLNVLAGENNFQFGTDPQTYGYCVDLQAMAGNGPATKTDTSLLNAGFTIGYLLQTYAPVYHASVDKHGATALQLAIWDLLYDSPTGPNAPNNLTFNMGLGNFKADTIKVNGVAFDPTPYFTTFQSSLNGSDLATLYKSNSGSIQSFAAVPEPASLIALALGGAALLRRRKLR
ncbi:MAG: PEP-CTERM sorting domain-containing protein [Chlorobia bacterium]|nr:PEP-CTERM sorting domain-containing protein [Fimbriimonadaceae bacterium]